MSIVAQSQGITSCLWLLYAASISSAENIAKTNDTSVLEMQLNALTPSYSPSQFQKKSSGFERCDNIKDRNIIINTSKIDLTKFVASIDPGCQIDDLKFVEWISIEEYEIKDKSSRINDTKWAMLIIFVPCCREQPHQLCFIVAKVWWKPNQIGTFSAECCCSTSSISLDTPIEALRIVAKVVCFDYGYHTLVVYFYVYSSFCKV